MKRPTASNFVASRLRLTAWAGVALAVALAATAGVVVEWRRLDALRDASDSLEARIGQRRRAVDRERQQETARTPEQRRIERLLDEQARHANGSGLPVLDWIEHAWTPHIALTSLTVSQAGQEARLEAGAADLSQIYLFVDRLSDRHPDRKIGLLQHRATLEDGRSAFHFSLSIEAQGPP